MRHHRRARALGRKRNARRALLKSLARSLILTGAITTTEARAKELRPFVEKLTTRARGASLSAGQAGLGARRILVARLGSSDAARVLVEKIAPKFEKVSGGYLRITKLGVRRSDGSRKALISFTH